MLQPKKVKLNPAQKARATSKTKSKAPAGYDVDWDAVRNVNDNVAVQTAKMFDPTGISSWPDVYYAIDDYNKGKGSGWNIALNVVGALPMVGKAKSIFRLGKYANASKTVKNTVKVAKAVEKVAVKANKATSLTHLATSANRAKKVVGKTAVGAEKVAKWMSKPITPKSKTVTSKIFDKIDAQNLAVDAIDLANVGADATSVVKAGVNAVTPKKETAPVIDKKKVIQYYNTNPKHGEVEKAGTEANVQYLPVQNSIELQRWKEQKLAFGTDSSGITPNPKKKFKPLKYPSVEELIKKTEDKFVDKKDVNLIVKDNTDVAKDLEIKKVTPKTKKPVTSDVETKVLNTLLGKMMPDQAAQFLSAIATGDNKLGLNDLSPDIRDSLIKSIENAKKRTGETSGGTQYIDYSPEVEESFEGMTAGPGKMLSIDPDVQAATMLGRVSYKVNDKGETEIYDSYDFSKTDPAKANTLYKKIRNYAGEVLPDEGNTPNLIGVIPPDQELAFGTNTNGIMKTKMKRYAGGTNANGIDPSHFIPNPADVLNDYNIMLAKTEAKANSNPWLPIVATAGSLLQQGVSMYGNRTPKPKTDTADINASNDLEGVVSANGNNNVNSDVEVEGGEMYETPQGQVGEFEGPSHEQGGIPLEVGQDVQEGTKVYSDRLKVGDKTLAERKATRERQTANLEKIASNPLVDQAVKNATKRKMMAIQKEEAADLDFQEKVNNVQAMADTMVQAFACGTGMKGVQKYAGGTSRNGIQYDDNGNPILGFAEGFGMEAEEAAENPLYYDTNPKSKSTSNPNIDYGKLLSFSIPEGINDNASLSYGDPYAKDGVNFEMPAETVMTPVSAYNGEPEVKTKVDKPGTAVGRFMDKAGNAVNKMGGVPVLGDMTKLIGNYLGMTAGIKTAAEQRSTDVTHTNVYANAGKDSQKMLDNAKKGIEINKAQAMIKATDVGRGGKRGGRNSARGVNQMRGMDWLYDTALQSQIAEISANVAGQISNIDVQKSGVAMNADQLKGQGQYQADMANEAAKDAYYTALGLGRKDFATGLQQSGKDLNSMKENDIVSNLLSQYGQWFKANPDGTLGNRNKTKK